MAEKKGYVATTKFLIASPTKVRPVAHVINQQPCSKALAILANMPQKGAGKGHHPVTPWGQPCRGYKTRNKRKPSNRFIVSRRKK